MAATRSVHQLALTYRIVTLLSLVTIVEKSSRAEWAMVCAIVANVKMS